MLFRQSLSPASNVFRSGVRFGIQGRCTVRVIRKMLARWALAALAGAVVFGAIAPEAWAPARDFAPRFSTNDTGNITIVGNTLMTCAASATCTQAQAGTAVGANNNNNHTMVRIDQDTDPATTLDSTSANLTLPSGATVLFAGLYYGAETTAGTGGQPRARTRRSPRTPST
jgi:hypothetical protein